MILRWTLIAVAWIVFVAGVLAYQYFGGMVSVGAGYVAKETCSCVYLGARTLESCLGDVPEYMADIRAEPAADGPGVRAFVPLMAEREARFEAGFGCILRQ